MSNYKIHECHVQGYKSTKGHKQNDHMPTKGFKINESDQLVQIEIAPI